MGILGSSTSFPSTDWSAVAVAAAGDDPGARAALDCLLTRYLPALRIFLLRELRIDPHVGEDLLQGFVAERILERNLLAEADRARGKFRTFLLACLTRYVSNESRREHAKKRHPGSGRLRNGLSEEAAGRFAHNPQPCMELFELAWARQVVAEAIERMRQECEEVLRPDLWALFEGRVLLPATEGTAAMEYPEVVERFGFDSVAQATNALVTAKRMYVRHLRAAVAQYMEGEDSSVDEELRRLKQVLAGR
jgi:RNA polymerase sigma-70 factor (ECF subfamily)